MAPIGAIIAFIIIFRQYSRFYLLPEDSFMRILTIGVIGIAGLLAGCGGGGNGANNGTNPAAPSVQQPPTQPPSGPKTYVAAQATVDDYYTFRRSTHRFEGLGLIDEIAYSTRLVTSAAADGSKSWRYLEHSPSDSASTSYLSMTYSADFDSQGRRMMTTSPRCVTTPSTPYHLVAPYGMGPGATLQYAGVDSSKCSGPGTSPPEAVSFTDNAGAMEQVAVAAGIFNAIKVSRTSISETDSSKTTVEHTCWWEPDLGIEVKCNSQTTLSWKPTGPSFSRTDSLELLGYSNKKLGRKVDPVQRFVGTWSGRFDGVAFGQNISGTCQMDFAADGNIKGRCGGANVRFDVIGTVSANGNLVFSLSRNGIAGQTITGKFDNILQISGAWAVPDVGSGTWSIGQ